MRLRITFAALAAFAIMTGPADARHKIYRTAPAVPAHFDAAAAPAYPMTDQSTGYQARSRGHGQRVIASRGEQEAKEARRAAQRPANGQIGHSGLVTVSTAAGINITVHPAYAAKFQAFIGALVAQGHKPRFITCYARGHKSGSNHAWGGACDIDQTGWGRTSSFMYHSDGLIRSVGLYSGCTFRDCGHVEGVRGLHNKPPALMAAIEKFKAHQSTMNYHP